MVGVEFSVGGWFASPVIKSVLEKAQKYLGANYELHKDTEELFWELNRTLLCCKGFTIEVQNKAIIKNEALAAWLMILKDTVYDAEDVLDNMEAKSIKDKVQGKIKVRKLASSSLSAVSNMFSPDDNLKSLNKVVDRLNKLCTEIPNIHKSIKMNIKNNESHTRAVTDQRETISKPLKEVDLSGREDELKQILDIILRSELKSSKKGGHGLLVIPIVGMGGVGKTALAQAVYNNPEVPKKFPSKAWISVFNKHDVDVKSVMREIYQAFEFSSSDFSTLQAIFMNSPLYIGRVGKFLIVLDDMFEMIESEWKKLYIALSCGVSGSVVLITTQNQVFAKRVGTFDPIALSPLDADIFWKLFENFAFGNEEIPEEKSIILGKKIAAKLPGLPLAAEIIGK